MRISLSIRLLAFALMMLAIRVGSAAGIIFSIGIAPPPLPVYEQPFCPDDGYIWTPGYWVYGDYFECDYRSNSAARRSPKMAVLEAATVFPLCIAASSIQF